MKKKSAADRLKEIVNEYDRICKLQSTGRVSFLELLNYGLVNKLAIERTEKTKENLN